MNVCSKLLYFICVIGISINLPFVYPSLHFYITIRNKNSSFFDTYTHNLLSKFIKNKTTKCLMPVMDRMFFHNAIHSPNNYSVRTKITLYMIININSVALKCNVFALPFSETFF